MVNVVELKSAAERNGISSVLHNFGRDVRVSIPLSKEFMLIPIDELNLTVRSRNGLMRAGLSNVGKLAEAIMSECGIDRIRNLGKKSSQEIKSVLLDESYARLSDEERDIFWNKLKEDNAI